MTLVAQGAILLGVVLASIGLLWLARRSPWNARFAGEVGEHNKAFDFLGTAFAVLLAFVVLEAYESYNDAKSGAEEEAEAVLELSRTAEAFSPEDHAHLEGLLVCYGRAVVHHAWTAMEKRGGQSHRERLGHSVPRGGVGVGDQLARRPGVVPPAAHGTGRTNPRPTYAASRGSPRCAVPALARAADGRHADDRLGHPERGAAGQLPGPGVGGCFRRSDGDGGVAARLLPRPPLRGGEREHQTDRDGAHP